MSRSARKVYATAGYDVYRLDLARWRDPALTPAPSAVATSTAAEAAAPAGAVAPAVTR